MTNHHDELRVAPDPVRAEDLRRRLHARLVSGSRDEPLVPGERAVAAIPSADTDPDDREGDLIMLETEDRPTGYEPPTPGRGAPGRWLLVAAMIAVVAVAGAVLVAAAGDDDETQVPATDTTAPAQNAMGLPEDTTEYEPGRYYIDPDGDETTPLRVTFQVTSGGWTPWPGAYTFSGESLTGFSVTTVTNLTANACAGDGPLVPPVGPTVDDLATALTQLPPFEVAAPPTDVTLGGYTGKHLELTTPDLRITGSAGNRQFADCVDGHLFSWISPILGGPFWGYEPAADIREEFWILDVEGTRLVLVKVDSPSSPAESLAERDAMFDSISIEP
jgi:hypothetical protein